MSQTSIERQKDYSRNRPGAAKAHSHYIERGGATAELNSGTSKRGDASTLSTYETAEEDSPHVARTAATSDSMQQDGPADPEVEAIPAQHDAYLARPGAVAERANARLAIVTNIADEQNERALFWKLIDEQEAKRGPDRLSIDIDANPEFWNRIGQRSDCPAELAAALASDQAKDRKRFIIRDGERMRRYLAAKDGWPDTKDTSRTAKQALQAMGVKFHDGRGGRTQNRIVGELPNELTVEQNFELMRDFSRKFDEANMPFVAVMHAPDLSNDKKNWHFHLDYHDRPCRSITMADIGKLSLDGYDTSALKPGDWDFAVTVTHKDRPKRKVRPLRKNKVKVVSRSRDWPLELRKHLEATTNKHLEAAGVVRRVDHRKHEAMGIKGLSQTHLDTARSAVEVKGGVTKLGIENERRQWEAIQQERETAYELSVRNLRENGRETAMQRNERERNNANAAEPDSVKVEMAVRNRLAANRLRRDAELLELEVERGRTRAKMLLRKNSRKLNGQQAEIDRGEAASDTECSRIVREATGYLAWFDTTFKNEIAEIAAWRAAASELIRSADEDKHTALSQTTIDVNDMDDEASLASEPDAPSVASADIQNSTKSTHLDHQQPGRRATDHEQSDGEQIAHQRRIHKAMINDFLKRTEHQAIEFAQAPDGTISPKDQKSLGLENINFALAAPDDRDILEGRHLQQKREHADLERAWDAELTDRIDSSSDRAILDALPAALYLAGKKWLTTQYGAALRRRLREKRQVEGEEALKEWRAAGKLPHAQLREKAKTAQRALSRSSVNLTPNEREALNVDASRRTGLHGSRSGPLPFDHGPER